MQLNHTVYKYSSLLKNGNHKFIRKNYLNTFSLFVNSKTRLFSIYDRRQNVYLV